MLSESILEKLVPHIKMVLAKEDYHILSNMFQEVYKVSFSDGDVYVLGDKTNEMPWIKFDVKTYAYKGIMMYEDAVKFGELI